MSYTMLSPLEINTWSEQSLSDLAVQISNNVPRPLIVVDGAAGSGKTTLAYRPKGWIKENRPGTIDVDSGKALIIEGMGACRKTMRAAATYSIWVDAEPHIARMRVVQRDLANGENGGTVESVTKFADWWDSLLKPLFLEEEPWNYVDVIVSGIQSDLSQDKLMIHIPAGKIIPSTGNCAGLHDSHL